MDRKITILLSFLTLTTLMVCAQAPVSPGVEKDLEQYRMQRLQEKLFVHTDKEVYLAGEICWFKLYTVDAGSHQPLDLSKVAYLEWLDKDNRPVLQAKTGLNKGHGDGSLYLPLTVRTGNYKLRGYTSWMKNFGADWFFEKTVTIINTRRGSETPAAPPATKYSIAFFPEGGNLVENMPGKVGFRVTDQYGRGVACTGVITEDEQDTLAHADPWRFGIGSFVYTPRPGHHYRGVFRLEDGSAIDALLPAAVKEGMVMSVLPEGQHALRVTVRSTGDGAIYLLAHTRQSVKQAQAAVLQTGKASFLVSRDSLGDGVSHLTIFNAARQPVCERLVFKQPARRLHITLQPDKKVYTTREKISLDVHTEGEGSHALAADCSLSVFLVDSLAPAAMDHILPWLWLVSDLKGKIESPEYYFDHPEDEQAMDNLMITHGWRRFRWDDVLRHRDAVFEFPPEYHGTIVSGRVVDTHTGAPAPGSILTYLSIPGTRTQFSVARSDNQGQVRFELPDFYGSQELILQTNPVDSQYKAEIANPFSEKYTDIPLAPYNPPQRFAPLLTDRNVSEQVLNRYAGIRLKQLKVPVSDTGTFFYRPDYSYLLDDFVRFTTMEEVMREYVTMMYVKRQNGHFHLPLFNLPYSEPFAADPLILLDGVPVFDVDKLMALDPLKLRKLETVQRRYFLGGTNFGGIMNWISYKGDLAGYILDPHAVVVDYEGLELEREFYSPSYETEEARTSHLPDFRNVLYWSPGVLTDGQGKKTLSFYSSDLSGRYIIVAEGLAADGTAGGGIAGFEVK